MYTQRVHKPDLKRNAKIYPLGTVQVGKYLCIQNTKQRGFWNGFKNRVRNYPTYITEK